MANINNIKTAQNGEQYEAVVTSHGEHSYLFVMAIGNNLSHVITLDWWSNSEDTMKAWAAGMAVSARTLKRTAGVLTYEKGWDSEGRAHWYLVHTCDVSGGLLCPPVLNDADVERIGMK